MKLQKQIVGSTHKIEISSVPAELDIDRQQTEFLLEKNGSSINQP